MPDPNGKTEQRRLSGVVLSRLVSVACLTVRLLALVIASVFLLPFIGIAGLWDEWKSELEMIRNGY